MSNGSEPSIWKQITNAVLGLFESQHRELITVMRQPTPIKVTTALQANASGVILPTMLYQCPMSQEAWINRISIQSSAGTPTSPLTTGELLCFSGSGELLFFAPIAGVVAPMLITEGRLSAPHLTHGAPMNIQGDGLPANATFRIDMQIVLVQGVSEFTPREGVRNLVDIMP